VFDRDRPPEPVDALLCIAIVAELAPVLSLLHRFRLRSHRLGVGYLADVRVAVLRSGVGPAAAERRTRATLERIIPRSVWSVGSCGALVDTLAVGTVVTATSVLSSKQVPHAVSPVADLPSVVVHTVERPVFDPDRRAQVAQSGAQVCEMEAAGVVRAVGGRCPVHLLKIVSDQAGGTPDPAVALGSARAQALFHTRVEHLMRTVVAPQLALRVRSTLACLDAVSSGEPTG